MTKSVMQHVAKVVRSGSKTSLVVLKKVGGTHAKVGLVAAILFILACAVEAKAISTLESSPNLFGDTH
jgi:hypothetical protein